MTTIRELLMRSRTPAVLADGSSAYRTIARRAITHSATIHCVVLLCAILLLGVSARPLSAQSDPLDAVRRTLPADSAESRLALLGLLRGTVAEVGAAEARLAASLDRGEDPSAGEQDELITAAIESRGLLTALLDTIVFHTDWGEEELLRLRRRYPASVVFLRYEAELASRNGELENALAIYDRLLGMRAADTELQVARAEVLEGLGRDAEAIIAYTRALELAPTDEALFHTLVRLHQGAGSLSKLLEQVERLRSLHPDDPKLAEWEIEVRHRLGQGGGDADTTEVASIETVGSRPPLGGLTLEGVDLEDPLVFGGQARVSSDLYHSNGIDARRPGSAWQMMLTPQLSLFRAVTIEVDALVSSDQSHLRQNMNHIGLKPRWGWGALHIGDFNRDYSSYILQGTRVRGGGIDLFTNRLRLSIQGGRLQRKTAGSLDGPVYRRNMIAASIGVGREMGTHLNLSMISAKDDISEEDHLIVQDTILIDTLHLDLRPQVEVRPQDNLALGLDGQLVLFQRILTLRGATAISLLTRDLLADSIAFGEDDLPPGTGWITERHQPRLSSSVDYAYEVEGTLALDAFRLRGGYESVGPGYASLGLPYLINDRQSYHLNAVIQLWDGRLALQGQFRNQANNLASQRLNTVERITANAGITARLTESVATTLTGLYMTVGNDAPSDSARLDNQSLALTANTSVQGELFGRASVFTMGYSIQQTNDGNILSPVPAITTQNLTGSVQVTLSPSITIAPSVSGAVTTGEGIERENNLLYGFRGNGRFLDGDLRTMANFNYTISHGRKVTGAQFQASYPLWWDADISFQARHNRYSAFGNRPEFQESFVTTSISRSF